MSLRRSGLLVLCALFIAAIPVAATELGDDAPALKIEKWVKGGPIDLKDGKEKNTYVIEFWATWCPPCRSSIPHLTEVQKKYKDKNVIVVAVSTDNEKTRDKVEPFVKDQGDKMGFVVAMDGKDGATKKAYMEAFVLDGIPEAFVIDKAGKILWHGHPMDGMDEALDEILAGKYDLKAAQKADKERRVEAEKITKIREVLNKYFKLISDSEKPEGAEKLGDEALTACGKDANLINAFAWRLLTDEEVKFRDLKFALRIAKAAYDASKGENPAIVDTYARALFDNGMVKEAIEQQKKAVKLVIDDEEARAEMAKTLKGYEDAAKEKK